MKKITVDIEKKPVETTVIKAYFEQLVKKQVEEKETNE